MFFGYFGSGGNKEKKDAGSLPSSTSVISGKGETSMVMRRAEENSS